LFGAEFANVQPHSGAQADAAVLAALMDPGQRLLGLDLANGGHLTHGMKLNFSGKVYESGFYGVDPETGLIDMDAVRAKAREFRPKVLVGGWSAYPRTLDFAAFRSIADEICAHLWIDMAHFAGLVAAGLHPSPVPHADLVSTTVHKTLGGAHSGLILGKQTYAKAVNSSDFPGTQGGPAMQVVAAKAVTFKIATPRNSLSDNGAPSTALASSPTGCWHPSSPRRESALSPGAPTSTSFWQIYATLPSTARRPRIFCTTSASPSTATPYRTTRDRRWLPRDCVSALRRWPPAALMMPPSPKWPTSSPPRCRRAQRRTS
jgi:hypothetical protein